MAADDAGPAVVAQCDPLCGLCGRGPHLLSRRLSTCGCADSITRAHRSGSEVRPVRQSRASLVLGLALVVGAFAYLMAFPPALDIADESYVLYESKRLWEGDAPYRD